MRLRVHGAYSRLSVLKHMEIIRILGILYAKSTQSILENISIEAYVDYQYIGYTGDYEYRAHTRDYQYVRHTTDCHYVAY